MNKKTGGERSKSPPEGTKGASLPKDFLADENIDELEKTIRIHYQNYQDYVIRAQVEMKAPSQLGPGPHKPIRHFYFQPKIPFLDDPERQRTYRRNFLNEMAEAPEQEPLILIGDVMHRQLLDTIGDRSHPTTVKNDLAIFFKRRLATLDAKKFKMISRWAFHSKMSVPDLERTSITLDKALGRLQLEIDHTINRVDRLASEDNFNATANNRPIPSTKDESDHTKSRPLYQDKDENSHSSSSSLRQDDIEVFMRMQTYKNRLFRLFDKFTVEVSWLPYLSRFEIWEQSRIIIQDYKHETYEKHKDLKKRMGANIKRKLEQNGIIEERIVSAVIDKFTKNIKGPDGGSSLDVPRMKYLLNSHKTQHERPPILVSSIIEINMQLAEIASEFGIEGDFELDNGQMQTYRIQIIFPTHFTQQTLQLQFDKFDSTKVSDYLNTDRILKNMEQAQIESNQAQSVEEMKLISVLESKKSLIGRLNNNNLRDAQSLQVRDKIDLERLEAVARDNNVGAHFFTFDASQYKLKQADWLAHVCFEPVIPESIKRQSIHFNKIPQYDGLLESAFNFIDINDQSAVNRIIEESAASHVNRAMHRNLTKYESELTEDAELELFLKNSLIKSGQAKHDQISKQQLQELKEQIKGAEKPLHLTDPIPNNLIKAYYQLRVLKSRDCKIRLLHSLNFFRSVQKRMALDLKTIITRSRPIIPGIDGEVIAPQFEKSDQLSGIRYQEDTEGGPGSIFQLHSGKEIDGDCSKDHPVTFKALKYNKQFSPAVSSTCPSLPRLHVTYQRPRLYEQLSQESQRTFDSAIPLSKQLKRFEGQRDRWEIDEDNEDATVYDEYGIKIIYSEAINDMLELEEELIKIGTHFINRSEQQMIDMDIEAAQSAIDRGDVALQLIQMESTFQFSKLLLVERYLEAYEHTTDPLELLRQAQQIVDLMAQRPRLNVEGSYFVDAYRNEIEVLIQKRELVRELVDLQVEIERRECEEIREFNELKYRKIQDHIEGKWTYADPQKRQVVMSANEEEQHKKLLAMNNQNGQGVGGTVTMEEVRSKAKQEEEAKRLRIKEIAQRHITEFIDGKFADFEDILGMQQLEANKRMDSHVVDPHVVDVMKESAHFSKQIDGYPQYFERDPFSQYSLFGNHSHRVGILDFFESLSSFSKIEASLQQALSELESVHMPENGFSIASLERALIVEARSRLKILRTEEPIITQSKTIIEDEFYFGNTDKLMFLAKEFRAHLSPELIKYRSNPLLVAKLDIKTVSRFDFPRVKQKDLLHLKASEELNPDQILSRMINISKTCVTGDENEKRAKLKVAAQAAGKKDKDLFSFDSDEVDSLPLHPPSLMVMTCHLVETLRLREEIISKVHESDILSIIYKRQLALVNKSNTKLVLSDQINFDIQKILTDSLNLVDLNDGSRLEFDLAFKEFDYSLRANLDFRSESCIKALMTELGLEELRAVLHYQTMQLQLLQIGVMINQAIMEGSMKALSEIEFLGRRKPFTVPHSLLNLPHIISRTAEGNMSELLSKERSRCKQVLSRECGEVMFYIDGKKSKHRSTFASKFSTASLRLGGHLQTEVKLRLLRSQRIKLLHCFCKEILKEAYQDVLKAQTISVNNRLRLFSMLLPKEFNFFDYGLGGIQDNFAYGFASFPSQKLNKEQGREVNLQSVLNGEALYYIPSSDEIMHLEPLSRATNLDCVIPGGDTVDEANVDKQIKELVKRATPQFHQRHDEGIKLSLRKVSFDEAYPQTSQSFKLLSFITLLYRNLRLQYLMFRNSSPSSETLALEDAIHCGIPFWEQTLSESGEQASSSSVSLRIIDRIIQRKQGRRALFEDLKYMAERLSNNLKLWLSREYTSNLELQVGKVERVIELLTLQGGILYKSFLTSIDQIVDTYLDRGEDECLQKALDIRDRLTRKVPAYNRYYENGFTMNQLALQSLHLDVRRRSFTDHSDYVHIYQAYSDEQRLVPLEVQLAKGMFSKNTLTEHLCHHSMVQPSQRDYSYLENCFYNLTDEQRQYAFTNFLQQEEKLKAYLKFKRLSLGENTIKQMLVAELEYFSVVSEARQLQHVLLCWVNQGDLPRTCREYKRLSKRYKDMTVLKIIEERDLIIANERARQAAEAEKKRRNAEMLAEEGGEGLSRKVDTRPFGQRVSRESMREMLTENNIADQHFFSTLCERRAESAVVRRLLEIKLMNFALKMLRQEHSSLLAVFEQAASEKQISIHMHPDQQYAQTLSATLNESPHLDITNKLSAVQQFITRLRNRCTEVETLTSGVGIVFSLRDFNECLQTMCRSILKYGEEELFTRVETAAVKENQYKHLLYLKDRQAAYYKHKCEHLLRDLDKLVSAKLSQRGSQIVYELDLSSRELRLMKDSVFAMERMMRGELRHEYERFILERENEVARYRASFNGYKDDLNNQIKEEVAVRINETGVEIKNLVQRKIMQSAGIKPGFGGPRAASQYSDYEEEEEGPGKNGKQGASQPEGYYGERQMREINALTKLIRKYKVFTKLKEVITRERHERELFNQRKRLTSNECLWEQLAESEKRENITRQELYFAQQNLTTYEKIVGKLQHQLETLQTERLRLLQFKSAKSKQIEAMETKIRDVELLENIDLQKVLDELRSRESRLKQLSQENRHFSERIALVAEAGERKAQTVKRQLEGEREKKAQALHALENMRLEIKAFEGVAAAGGELWKAKCLELFEICKDLQEENEELKEVVAQAQQLKQVVPLKKVESQPFEEPQQHYYATSGMKKEGSMPANLTSFDSNRAHRDLLASGEGLQYSTKPSTAAGYGFRHQTGRHGARIQSSNQTRLVTSGGMRGGLEGTLTSGMSLPEFGGESDGGNRSPLSSLNQKSGIKDAVRMSGLNKSRDVMRPQAYRLGGNTSESNQPPFSAASSEQLRQIQQRGGGGKGVSIRTGDELSSGAEGMGGQFVQDIKQSAPNARSTAGIVFNSGGIGSGAPSRGSGALIVNSHQRVQGKRLMTSQGPRKVQPPMNNIDQSTTGTLQSSNIANMREYMMSGGIGGPPSTSLRKSGVGTTRTNPLLPFQPQQIQGASNLQLNQHTSANLAAGLSIANASLPFGPQALLGGGPLKGQAINLNINFNTTNINMKQ